MPRQKKEIEPLLDCSCETIRERERSKLFCELFCLNKAVTTEPTWRVQQGSSCAQGRNIAMGCIHAAINNAELGVPAPFVNNAVQSFKPFCYWTNQSCQAICLKPQAADRCTQSVKGDLLVGGLPRAYYLHALM
jgi:hypothetical protein